MAPDERKELFADHLIEYVPLAAHIRRVLEERPDHHAPISRFREELEDHMAGNSAEQTLRTVIGWARFGEAFAYSETAGVLHLPAAAV